MRAFWIAVDMVVGLCIGGVLYAVASALVPRFTGTLALALTLAGCVLLMLVRYPGAGRRSLQADINSPIPPLVIKVVMAWLSSAVIVALLTIVLQLWNMALPEWGTWVVFVVSFAAWFLPGVRSPGRDWRETRWRSS